MRELHANQPLSLALHAAVAAKIRRDPSLVATAAANLERWAATGGWHPYYVDGWRVLLAGPREALLAFLVDDSERACDFRSASPFAGALTAAERWAIWYQFRGPHVAQGRVDEPA